MANQKSVVQMLACAAFGGAAVFGTIRFLSGPPAAKADPHAPPPASGAHADPHAPARDPHADPHAAATHDPHAPSHDPHAAPSHDAHDPHAAAPAESGHAPSAHASPAMGGDPHATSHAAPGGHASSAPSAAPSTARTHPFGVVRAPEPVRAAEPTRAGTARPLTPSISPAESYASPAANAATPPSELVEPSPAEVAFNLLLEGNERWATGRPTSPNIEPSRMGDLARNGQKPFVTILTCADSRIPVERVFDRGVGDLFVVRVAGNVVGPAEGGTIEYGLEHLGTPLLVVMGHTRCGAVAAAATGALVHGQVARLLESVAPAVDRAQRHNPSLVGDALVPEAVKENVWQSVYDVLRSSDAARGLVRAGQLRVIGAVYDIESGRVEWLGEHPWQSELLDALSARQGVALEHAIEPAH